MKVFKTKEGVVRSGWSILLSMVVMYGWQILLGVGLGIIIGVVLAVTRGEVNPSAVMEAAEVVSGSNLFQYATYAVNIALLLGLWKLLYRLPLKRMGLSARRWLPNLMYGLLFGAASMALVFACLAVTGNTQVLSANGAVLLHPEFWGGFIKFVFVGFFEEMLSRGYMMSALKTTRNKWVIMLLPAVLFGFLHIFNPSVGAFPIINIALVGLLFAYMFVKTGDIWMPIGYHITWNFFQGNVFGYQVSGGEGYASLVTVADAGHPAVTGGAFGPEGGLVVTIVILLGLLWVRMLVKSRLHEGFWHMVDAAPEPAVQEPQDATELPPEPGAEG